MDNIEILSNPESTIISIFSSRDLVVETQTTEEDGSGEENSMISSEQLKKKGCRILKV